MTWLGILKLLKSVPAWLWGVLLAALVLAAVHHHGVNSGLAKCEEAHRKAQEAVDEKQAKAIAKRDDKAASIATDSHKVAADVSAKVQSDTAKSQGKIRELSKASPSVCALPAGVRDELDQAVRSANSAKG